MKELPQVAELKRPTKLKKTHLFHEKTPKSQSETRICKESAFAHDGSIGKIKKPRLPLAPGSSLDHSDKPRILTTHEEAGRRKSTPMTQRQMQPWPTCPIQRPLNILNTDHLRPKKYLQYCCCKDWSCRKLKTEPKSS